MGTPSKIKQILEQVAEAMAQTAIDIRAHMKGHPEFTQIGNRMLQKWDKGRAHSLLSG